MSAVIFYLSLPLIFLVSILPFRVLFVLSDLLFTLIYYLAAYRKKVVMENLRNAFPEKSEKERQAIAIKFYRHFTDVILEILKMRTVSPRVLKKRISYSNPEVLQDIYDRGKSVMVMSAHYNNWKWTSACAESGPHHSIVIYKPLHNKYFDRFMKKARERHGVEMLPMRDTLRRVLQDKREENFALYGLISDQSPVWEEVQYWTSFLNQLTPVFTGVEKLAVKTGMSVVYYSMRKIKRGRYIIDLIPLSDDPVSTEENEITEKFIRTMEDFIRKNPEYWLWTHRRWKLTPRKLAEMENS